MPKRKKGPADETGKPRRKRETGEVLLLTVEIDPPLMQALQRYMQGELRTRRATVTLALQSLFRQAGYWPPPSEGVP